MPVRVLLADENLAVQKLVELTLNKEGIEVTTTDNGLSALDIAIKSPPDVILADFKMEGMDIVSFIKKTKKREHLSDIPIIVLMNATETHDPAYLRSLGAEAFFKKPIDTQELISGIKKLTATSDAAFDLSDEVSNPDPSDLSQHFSSSEEESNTISEMLGWSTTTEENQEIKEQESGASPNSTASCETAIPAESAETSAQGSESETHGIDALGEQGLSEEDPFSFPFEEDDPFSQSEQKDESPSLDEETILPPSSSNFEPSILEKEDNEALEALPFEESEPSDAAQDAQRSQTEMGSENGTALDDKTMKAVLASTEKVVKALLPDLVKSSLSKEMIADIVQEVVWEAVTPLAEAEIKKAIKHLQAEAD